ncbi:MAG: hypothetical protein HC897_04085 [Thermoanaerobaculia bacterium]|nr:hypothetical protein [Thermoanaerobaculia bacterium]
MRLSIPAKLLGAFALDLALMLALGVFALDRMREMHTARSSSKPRPCPASPTSSA